MYGVIIEKGPQNWQVLQQCNGYAEAALSGRVEVEAEVLACADAAVVLRVTDENTNARITEPLFVTPRGGKWCAKLRIPAGGPYKIECCLRYNKVCEKRGDRRFHIGVGDVYVITGQSNAVGVGKDSVNDPISPDVHMFRVSGSWDIAAHPLHDTTDTLFPLSQEKAQTGHSPWLNFAKILARHLGYPIGLIPGTKGGIPLSCWDRSENGAYFTNMLEIVKASGSDVKGILWYQGCNDVYDKALRASYLERFKKVCADFRNTFYADIPILTVQLNKSTCTKNTNTQTEGENFAGIREAQRRAMLEIPGVYMAPSIDLMVCDGIHNASMSNMVIGERVANLALKYIYNKNIVCDAPDIEKAVQTGACTVRLYFKNVYDRIFSDYNCTDQLMFTLADEQGKLPPTDYNCPGDNTIELTFARAIAANAVINCDRYNDTGLMPYDLFSYLPVIPFNGCPVE